LLKISDEKMSSFDRESFHLLQMSDSMSDSLPDLDLVVPSNSKKKKVRLKRKERKSRQNIPLRSLEESWWNCSLSPQTGCANSSCLLVVVSTSFVIVLIVMGYLTSSLHTRLLMLEQQLRMKIVDDDSRSIPETLQSIQSKLQTLQSNQSEVLVNLSDLSKAVTNLQARLEMVNITVNKEGGEGQVKQSVADLGVKVSEIKQSLEVTTNTSNSNTVSINMIATELNSLKLNDIDLKNGGSAPHTAESSDVSNISSQLDNLNASLALQQQKLGKLNSTVLNVAQNSTVMIDWVKQDVVALQGKVSQLQDDNQNVSSRLASLSERCNSQFQTTVSNMSSLQLVVNKLASQVELVKNTKSLLIQTVLPTKPTSSPPGLDPVPHLPSSKASQAQANALPVVDTGPDIIPQADRVGPRDKRDSDIEVEQSEQSRK